MVGRVAAAGQEVPAALVVKGMFVLPEQRADFQRTDLCDGRWKMLSPKRTELKSLWSSGDFVLFLSEQWSYLVHRVGMPCMSVS